MLSSLFLILRCDRGMGDTVSDASGGWFCCLQSCPFLCCARSSIGSSRDHIGLSTFPRLFTCSCSVLYGSSAGRLRLGTPMCSAASALSTLPCRLPPCLTPMRTAVKIVDLARFVSFLEGGLYLSCGQAIRIRWRFGSDFLGQTNDVVSGGNYR